LAHKLQPPQFCACTPHISGNDESVRGASRQGWMVQVMQLS
jgi:hypothetical protein